MDLSSTCNTIVDVDEASRAAALERHGQLAKPPGALGALEGLGAQLAAIAGTCPPPRPHPAAIAVFAGDHGVVAQGVTPWPSEVTAAMVGVFRSGGAAISALARAVGASVLVVDVGVATDLPGAAQPSQLDPAATQGHPAARFESRRVRPGAGDILTGPAMARNEAVAALEVGIDVATSLVGDGARGLVMGEMGIGNTTPSAALISALCGADPAAATGRGTGIDDARLARKVEVVAAAVSRAGQSCDLANDPIGALAELGGLEIAALAGFVLGGAAARVPVVVDGVISLAATLVAVRLCPAALGYCVAGHRSTEPGASIALGALGLSPLLELDMRLGEGSGACLALPLLDGAARVLSEMATLADALG